MEIKLDKEWLEIIIFSISFEKMICSTKKWHKYGEFSFIEIKL